MIYGVNLRIKVDDQAKLLSEILDKELVYFYCTDVMDEYIVSGPLNERIVMKLKKQDEYKNIEIYNTEGKTVILMKPCRKDNHDHLMRIKSLLYQNQFSIVSYIQQIGEWQYYTTFTLSRAKIEDLIDQSPIHIEILDIQELPGMSISKIEPYIEIKDLVKNLTPTQYSAISMAINSGYYQIPRNVKLSDLAKQNNVSRPAFEKSFRVAENKILETVIENIYKYQARIGSHNQKKSK